MVHKVTGGHGRGNLGISRNSTAITVGKYTPSSYLSGSRTGSKLSAMHTIRQPGGHSAKVMRHPYGKGC